MSFRDAGYFISKATAGVISRKFFPKILEMIENVISVPPVGIESWFLNKMIMILWLNGMRTKNGEFLHHMLWYFRLQQTFSVNQMKCF